MGFTCLNTAIFSTTMTRNCLITHNEDSVTLKEDHSQYSATDNVCPDLHWVKTLVGCLRMMGIYHTENKLGPVTMLSAFNKWRMDVLETDHLPDANKYETGSSLNFISELSEGGSSQLHARIVKVANRVLLDEIISNVISEFVTSKNAQRHLKLDAINQATKSCSSDDKMLERHSDATADCESAACLNIADQICIMKCIHNLMQEQNLLEALRTFGALTKLFVGCLLNTVCKLCGMLSFMTV